MKQIEFKTIKGEFVVIDLYDTIDKTSLSLDNGFLTYRDHIGWDGIRIMDSDCINLGCIQDITEEQAKEVVDESIHAGLFAHYVKDVPVNTYCYRTATESLRWLLVSIGVEFKYERIDESMFYKRHSDSMSWGEYLTKEARSKVWNKQQTYLFKKI